MGGKTTSEIKTQINNELSMKIKNITKNINNITNTSTFELTQEIKNQAEASVDTNTIASNTIETGDIVIRRGSKVDLSQSAKINAVNSAIIKILSDASQLQSSSNNMADKIKSKIDNDIAAKQDVAFLAKVGEYNKNNGGPEALVSSLAGVVEKFISSVTGSNSSSVNETNIRNIVNTEIENQTINETNINNAISTSIKSNMDQLGKASCKTSNIADNRLKVGNIIVDDNGELIIDQTIDISAFTTCIIELELGSKIASTLTNDFKVDADSDGKNVVGADQKGKSDNVKETKTEKDSSIMKSIDNLVDNVGDVAGSFVYVIGGIILLIVLIMVGPSLMGSGTNQSTNSSSVAPRDYDDDDDDDDDGDYDDQRGGGGNISSNIYLFSSFITIFILISDKSLPLCGILLIVIILYLMNIKKLKNY
jgi:hypothetical protein